MKIMLTSIILLAGIPLTSAFPSFWRTAFCLPAAWLSAAFMNVHCVATPEAYILPHPALAIHVTPACSAAGFFVLLVAVSCGTIANRATRPGAGLIAAALFVCYDVAIIANVTRIVIGWQAGRLARALLPEYLWAGVHMAVGTLVFMIFLAFAYWLAGWWVNQTQRPNADVLSRPAWTRAQPQRRPVYGAK